MRLRNQVLLIVLATLFLTVGLLVGYYNLFLSSSTAHEFEQLQASLEVQCASYADHLPLEADFSRYLQQQADATGYQFHLLDLNGHTLYRTEDRDEPAISINATFPLQADGQTLLLRVTQFISIKSASSIPAVRRLFTAGILLFLFVLPVLYLILYIHYVRPIMRMQGDMQAYKAGIKPKRTARKDEIGQLQNAFVQLTEDLEVEKAKQNQIIASISHDIKTPLTSVMGYAERMQKSALTPERTSRYVSTIYDKAQTIRDLVEEFDDYLSCNLPGSLKKQIVTTNHLFSLLQEEYQEELTSLGVQMNLANQAPLQGVEVDISKIRRVFGNLISNSLKHFQGGEKSLWISCHAEGPFICFSFEDSGEGVPSSQLSQIFDPLFTSDAGRSVAGLGLSICREILQSHGGKIWAEPRKNGPGLCIRFCLPRV